MRILEEQKCNEKVIDSKVKYMRGTRPAQPAHESDARVGKDELNVQSPVVPSSEDDDSGKVSSRCWLLWMGTYIRWSAGAQPSQWLPRPRLRAC